MRDEYNIKKLNPRENPYAAQLKEIDSDQFGQISDAENEKDDEKRDV